MSKYCKLLMVGAEANNNKFYEMIWDGGADFEVKFGRVEGGAQTATYPYSKWGSKYNEKLKKGYKDVTQFVTTTDTTTSAPTADASTIKEAKVREFMQLMKKYTDGLVSNTYSVKAESVTQAQVDEAQAALNTLLKAGQKDADYVNRLLVELYTIIPRKMRHVRDHLLPNIRLDKALQQEQDNLDAMASQVSQITPRKAGKGGKNILDSLGISMQQCLAGKDIVYLINQITGSRTRVEAIFEVNKPEEDKIFKSWLSKQKNKDTKVLIHGTRCSSVIPILDTGLKIRPSGNFQFSGKVYGEGNYFSETVQKSLNYTGGQTDKILLVYEVHTGNPFVYDGWYTGNSFTLNYKNLQDRGYDSTFVKAGNGLLNSEVIAYKEEQNRIKYILWLK